MRNIKRLLIVFIIFIFSLVLVSCKSGNNPSGGKNNVVKNEYMLEEEEACFNFFWETQNVNEKSLGCGLIPDRYPSNGLASIASVGYGLASFVVGVHNGWITKQEGYDRVVMTLSKMKEIERVHGFYYHFYNEKIGGIAKDSEVSNIDSAIFLCGALVAGSYFEGDALKLANEIYDEVDWNWFIDKTVNQFYMSYNATTNKFGGHWDTYGEQLMMYFLGAGSKTHPIDKKVYYSFKRYTGSYKGEKFINSWFGSIFTYQFSHAFIDFRYMTDEDGVNWFDNSVKASLANYNYCVENPEGFNTYMKDQWGVTACDTPKGYSGLLGTLPSGTGMSQMFTNDGTIAPCGAIGSIVFVPDLVLPCFRNYSTLLDGSLIGVYGYKDAFNFDGTRPWIASSTIGIDKGISILMIENYRSELIWEYFMKCDFMDTAIERLGFTKVS